ncbi:MAG: hypothetical protein VX519_07975 [Myxococcota bacterium]|nr:hypothetical protein [Myxococcota bacterium]
MRSQGPPAPPMPEQVIDDPVTGSRCHYERPRDASFCEDILAYLQVAWQVQVEERGWPAPFEDGNHGGTPGLDWFVDPGIGGAWTSSNYNDADPNDGRTGGWAYIHIDPSISADELDIYVAHEFNHALQYALDMTESTSPPWEGVATIMEEVTFPGHGSWGDSVPHFQDVPWLSLLSDGDYLWDVYDLWSWYEYGSALFFEFLRQEYAIEPVDLWWAMTNTGWRNEPDVWDAVETLTGDAQEALMRFSIQRARVGTPAAPGWSSELSSKLTVEDEINHTGRITAASVDPYVLGVAWFDVEADGLLEFHMEGDFTTNWGIVVVEEGTLQKGTEPVVFEGPARIGVVNLGPTDFDPDEYCDWGCEFESHSLNAWVQDPESTGQEDDNRLGGDSPIAAESLTTAGCGCSLTPRSSGGIGLALWGLVWGLGRRRPAMQRTQSI